MGAWFGFPPLGLSGKTVVSARLMLTNLHTDNPSGITAVLGTHGNATAPATVAGQGGNVSLVPFSRGESKSVVLNSSLFTGLQNGTIRGFTLGVDSGAFGYWQGGGSNSERPILEVTYR